MVAKTDRTGYTGTISMFYLSANDTQGHFQVMWRVILSKTVVTVRLEIKIALITCCQDFFQIFIFEECCCFSNTRWNRVCASAGVNIFPRLGNMFIHFSTSEERHFGKVGRPAI